MDTFKNSQTVFKTISIDKFSDFSKGWIMSDEIYYLGSYLFDINGTRYKDINHWAGDVENVDDDDKEKAIEISKKEEYQKIYEVFQQKFDVISITECIQKKYLNIQDQILHLFRDSESNCCEILSLEGDIFLSNKKNNYRYIPQRISDLRSFLTDLGKEKVDSISSSFDFHFNLIRKAGNPHFYFFPSVLPLLGEAKIINVTMVVSLSKLDDGTLGVVQYGLGLGTSNLMSDTASYLYKLSQREATKSAKAAIMSRNMSHNLGSHVMSYLKHHLSTVKDMLNDKILSQLIENEDELENFIIKSGWKQIHGDIKKTIEVTNQNGLSEKESINNTEQPKDSANSIPNNVEVKDENNNETIQEKEVDKIALPFLVGLGQFISYLQERQDFIATIATDYVPYYSNVNFKDFIYDELNNDKRYERHPDRQNLKSDNILLGNIARSEGLGRTTRPTDIEGKKALNDIVLKFRSTFTGDPVESIMPAKGKQGVNPLNYYKNEDDVKKACDELDEMRDYEVSLPGGIVGRQAVFSIFENVIRNAAKHGNWREKGKLELTIDIFSKQDVLYPDENTKKRFIIDNYDENSLTLQEVLRKYYCNITEEDNLFFVTLTDNLTIPLESLNSLRKALIEDYIDSQGQMINTNKGIKEMRISSAWLRSIDDNPKESIIQPSVGDKSWDLSNLKVPPVLYARISKDEKGAHLQYIFCLLRPQIVALISSKITVFDNKQISSILQNKFWSVFTPDSYLKYKNKSFNFVLYDDISDVENEKENNKDTVFDKIRRFSSPRVIKLSDLQKKGFNEILPIRDYVLTGKDDPDSKCLETLIDGAVTSLYRYLSEWDGKEKIYINDVKAKNKYDNDKGNENLILSDKITFEKTDSNARYRYVTHLEGKNEFKYYVVDNEPNDTRTFAFSEGITGNNSTDRLVRNESLTNNWFYKHIYAMKQKVAIIDERIFSKTYGLEESSFIIGKITNFGNDGETDEEKLKTDKENLKQLFPDYYDDFISTTKSRQELDDFTVSVGYNPQTGKDLDSVDAESHLGATLVEKNVYVFSIIRSIENSQEPVFYLYGFEYDKNKTNFSRCIRYASISWDNKDKRMKIVSCSDAYNKVLNDFNYLSIHQGLLDKLYDAFGIKESKQSAKEKEELTKDLYSVFSNSDKIFNFTDENEEDKVTHYFLPGMTIHSGRSKPSKNDMPQHLPFVPYSAIEHAVLDCKFSLIELLNSARYE
jgi:hypothetical protein